MGDIEQLKLISDHLAELKQRRHELTIELESVKKCIKGRQILVHELKMRIKKVKDE